ncbi:hypothetical protein GCM10009865_05890 [Aeromicrobium ponti]|uniref:Uncharacterized protein n=1 Tax=Cytobacillus oceanisediminis TaxID=665099 RepID=A0A562K6J2_9BACI|nr:hypothetical protein [Cytobacillus oceanisediminis]TWH91040.1 hypothetical protein IQ19_00490 [Cytobacillus oceanisediminis]
MTLIFLGVSYIVLLLIILKMPKRLSLPEVYITFLVVSFHTLFADLLFADILDLYDLMKQNGPQFSDLAIQITLPVLFGILYLNFMPNEKEKFIPYFIFWVAFSTVYEQISRYFGYVEYKGWKIWFSVLFYIYACAFMRWHYRFIRNGINKE